MVIDANNMTPQELRSLADQKESATREKIAIDFCKTGILKHDIYASDTRGIEEIKRELETRHYILTEKQADNFKHKLSNTFEIIFLKGCEFVCYIDDGKENWCDNEGYGLTDMPKEWADKSLRDIQEIKK